MYPVDRGILLPSHPSLPSKRARLTPRSLLFLVLVGSGFAFFSAPQLFSPWVYFTGGAFHLVPWWTGVGTFTGPDGQYQLYLYLSPMYTGSALTRTTALTGAGHLCTPSGERLVLKVQGDMDKHLPRNTIGKRIEISSFVRSKPGTFSAYTPPGSPYVELNGVWAAGVIDANGKLEYQAPAPGQPKPPSPAPIAIVLHESGRWSTPACPRR